jgi:hypothetical protein
MTSADEEWRESSRVSTVGGALAGAAIGPVGTVAGGMAGAAAGAGLGAVGDVAGEKAENHFRRHDTATTAFHGARVDGAISPRRRHEALSWLPAGR